MPQEALDRNVDTIVAAGGDGSVNETAQALINLDAPEDIAIAVIPLGTANDFATGLSIPQDPRDALLLAATDTAYPIDIGLVNDKVPYHIFDIWLFVAWNDNTLELISVVIRPKFWLVADGLVMYCVMMSYHNIC